MTEETRIGWSEADQRSVREQLDRVRVQKRLDPPFTHDLEPMKDAAARR